MGRMVSMKNTKAQRHPKRNAVSMEQRAYPWGTSITLDGPQLRALGGLRGLEVGDTQTLRVRVKVTSISANDDGAGAHKSVGLQITHIEEPDGDMSLDERVAEDRD